ncbi:hypothetical protein ACOMHN_049653 [Nucella lapillus]
MKQNVNVMIENGKTPLSIACEKGNVKVTKMLLKAKAYVNVHRSETPLHSTVSKKGNIEILKLLINKHGADINIFDKSQKSVLYRSCSTGDVDMVDFLLQKGAQTQTASHPIFPAIEGEYCHIVKKLIQQGVSVNVTSKAFNTPLHCACKRLAKKSFEIVKMLLDMGANVNATNKACGTPLNVAASRKGSKDVVEMLLAKGAELENRSTLNMTPLVQAVCYSDREVVELLLSRGANTNSLSNFLFTPLHHAIVHQKLDLVELLIHYKADIEARTLLDVTPLHKACSNAYNVNIVKSLLGHGASVHVEDYQNMTPLHVASRLGKTEIVQLLLESQASTDARDIYERTPLDLARNCQHQHIFAILQHHVGGVL